MKLYLQLLSILVLLAFGSFVRAAERQQEPEPAQAGVQSSAGAGVTLANYMRLKEGTSYADVVRILGAEGTDTGSGAKHSRSGSKVVQYLWRGEGGGSMTALFSNGRLVSKAQSGLK